MERFVAPLRCPTCKSAGLRLSTAAAPGTPVPLHGYIVCESCGALYPIAQNILDLAIHERRLPLTLAGWTNDIPPAPQVYERYWRRRAMTLFTGEPFSVRREWDLLNEWTNVRPGEYIVDLGTSTGLYARGLALPGDAIVYAIDHAWRMLYAARNFIAREHRRGIVLTRAAAENLPFQDASIDAVVVGGSLNEMQTFTRPLLESFRVVRPGGRMFVMSLSRATRWRGRLLQFLARLSGIKFPPLTAFNTMVADAGWRITRQEQRGIVLFTLLQK